MGQVPQITSSEIAQHAKLCLKCNAWVFRHEAICPKCHADQFSEDVNQELRAAQQKAAKSQLILWLVVCAAIILAICTFGIGGIPGFIVSRLCILSNKAAQQKLEEIQAKSKAMQKQFEVEYSRLKQEMEFKVAQHNKEIENHVNTGLDSLMKRDFNQAEEQFKAAITIGADDWKTSAAYGILLYRNGSKEKGISFLEIARSKKKLSALDNLLYEIYKREDKITAAGLQFLVESGYCENYDAQSTLWLATKILQLGDYSSAQRIFKSLIQIAQTDHSAADYRFTAECGYYGAICCLGESNINGLYEWFSQNLTKLPCILISTTILVKNHITSPEAVPVYKSAWSTGMKNNLIFQTLFDHYLKSQEFSNALDLVKAAEDVIQSDIILSYKVALFYMQQHYIDKGISLLQSIKKNDGWQKKIPHDQLKIVLSNGFIKKGMLDLALSSIAEITELPKKHQELYRFGQHCLKCQEKAIALRSFMEIYREDAGYQDVSEMIDKLRGVNK